MSMTTTVTVAQALASAGSNLHVLDTGADIAAALPDAALVARVRLFTLSAPATLSAAAADLLASLGTKFQRNNEPLVISDTLAALASHTNAPGIALATQLQVADTAVNLLRAAPAAFSGISHVTLLGAPTLTIAQLTQLEALPGFSVAQSAHLTLADTGTAIASLLASHPAWLAPVSGLIVMLDGAPLGAYAAAQIVGLEGHGTAVRFAATAAANSLTVQARAQDLAGNAAALSQLAQQVTLHLGVTNPGAVVTAGQATALIGLPGLSLGQQAIYVADTGPAIQAAGAALFRAGFAGITVSAGTLAANAATLLSPLLHVAPGAACLLSASAIVTAAQANALAALPHSALGQHVSLTVQDSAANLEALSAGALAVATGEALPEGAVTITPQQAAFLAGLPGFSPVGSTITVAGSVADFAAAPGWAGVSQAEAVTDSAATLAAAALSPLLQHAASVLVSGSAAISVAQAVALAAIPHLNLNGAALSVAGSAAAVAQAASSLTAIATLIDATDAGPVTAAQAAALAGLQMSGKLVLQGGVPAIVDSYANILNAANAPGLALGGQITIADSAAALAGAVQHDWGAAHPAFLLSGPGSVTAAQAALLAGAGAAFSTNGYALCVADTAAALLALPQAAQSLASAEILTQSATLSAAQLDTLAARTGFVTGPGASLTVQDSAAALLGLNAADIAAATNFVLAANATVSAAQFLALRDTLHLAGGGNTLTVSGSATDLAALAGSDLSLASTLALSSDATITTAQAAALAGESGFTLNGHALTISGSAASLLALPPGAQGLATTIALSGDATVTAAQASALAGISGFSAAGHAITIEDSAAALSGLGAPALALASAETLNQSATLSLAQAEALAALPAISLAAGVSLTVSDVAASLLAVPQLVAALATAYALSADATVSAADFAFLRDTLHVAEAGHAVTIADSAAALLGLAGSDLSLASSCVLTADATVSAAQAILLAEEPGFSANGHELTVLGGAADILALSPASVHDASALDLNANQTVSTAQLTALAALGGEFSENTYTLTVSGTPAALLALPAPALALAGAITLSADATVSAAQLAGLAALPGFSTAGHALTVQDNAAALIALPAPSLALASAEILGTSASVTAAQAGMLAALPAFSCAPGVTLTVSDSAAALLSLPAGVSAIAGAYALSGDATVSAADFAALRDDLHVGLAGHTLGILDSAANLLSLAGGDLSLASSCLLSADATIGYAQAGALADEPGFSANGHALIVADSAFNILSLPPEVLAAVTLTELNGSQQVGCGELDALADLGAKFSANGYVIQVADSAQNLINLPQAALALASSEVVTISATLDAADMNSLAALPNLSVAPHATLTVLDTAANLLALSPGALNLAGALDLSADATVTAAQFASLRSLDVQTQDRAITISDSAAGLLGLSGSDLSLASGVGLSADASVSLAQALQLAAEPNFSTGGHTLTIVTDAATLSANLAALAADFPAPSGLAISLTDQSPALSVSAATYAASQALLDSISAPSVLTVTASAVQAASLTPALAADAHVGAVQVADTAGNIVGDLGALLTLGGKLSVTLTDSTPLAASLIPYLALLPGITASVGVSDTAGQIAAIVEQDEASGTTAATALLETLSATVSANSQVNLADLAALTRLGPSLSLAGHTISVVDTAAHLTAAGAAQALATAAQAGLISGVYLKTGGAPVTVSVAQLTTLIGLEGISLTQAPPQSGTISLIVHDTAAALAAAAGAISADAFAGYVGGVVVGAPATISDAQLAALQGIGAVAGPGATITVSDSAATIALEAGTQASGQSLTPAAWVLNGNAAVSAAQAITLAQLAGFSTGGHVLTLTASAALSVAQANEVAALAPALVLGGHDLSVSGNVAQLSALSAAAQAIVTPALQDSFANIIALPAHSPLLGGTVSISDAETVSAAHVLSFLGLLQANGGALAAAAVNFAGHTETVTGSIAQLQALTASTAWTNAVSVHGGFALVAQDSVGNLINPGNTAFLATLSGTTLATDGDVTAAQAEALASLAPQINFSLGGHALVIADTAPDLLAQENAAGLALATAIHLTAPATLDAAQAETLLSVPSVTLAATLTIADTSADLLDGALASAIAASAQAGNIVVQLAAPETLDAATAAALVAIPGFSAAAPFSIADDPAYLLAGANLTAEQLAASVTLDGDATVSANTVLRLSEIPHFIAGTNVLTLAGNDFADAATLKAIADLGAQFSDGGHSITATQDALGLTPAEYLALQNDGVLANGHAISAVLVSDSVSDVNNMMALSATGIAGATVNIYDAGGTLISVNPESQAAFTVTAPDPGAGHAFAITETVNGVESAPVVVLEAGLLETAAAAADAAFAASGAIAVDSGKYINLYTTGSVPQNMQVAALVYDPAAHTISLDLPHTQPITLITLGASTHPATLDASEILVKHHG